MSKRPRISDDTYPNKRNRLAVNLNSFDINIDTTIDIGVIMDNADDIVIQCDTVYYDIIIDSENQISSGEILLLCDELVVKIFQKIRSLRSSLNFMSTCKKFQIIALNNFNDMTYDKEYSYYTIPFINRICEIQTNNQCCQLKTFNVRDFGFPMDTSFFNTIAKFVNLKRLDINSINNFFTDEDILRLSALKKLNLLEIEDCNNVSTKSLCIAIANMPLRVLRLRKFIYDPQYSILKIASTMNVYDLGLFSEIPYPELNYITRMTQLEMLLIRPSINDLHSNIVSSFTVLTKLKQLAFISNDISQLEHDTITKLTSLTTLHLGIGVQINPAISSLTNLTYIELIGLIKLTDDHLRQLCKLSLTHVILKYLPSITGSGIKEIAKITTMRSLSIKNLDIGNDVIIEIGESNLQILILINLSNITIDCLYEFNLKPSFILLKIKKCPNITREIINASPRMTIADIYPIKVQILPIKKL